MKVFWARFFGWGQLAIVAVQQTSNGHFPQNKSEWVTLLTSAALAMSVHHAAATDGTK